MAAMVRPQPKVMKMTAHDTLAFYAPYFKNWQAKQLGEKPTAAMLEQVHGLGLRPGKQALACAMSLRATGVTGSQIVMVCGAPQLNRMRGLISDGHFKRLPAAATDGTNHTVYHNEVTPKGLKRIEARKATDEKARLDDGSKPAKAPKALGKAIVKAAPKSTKARVAKAMKAPKARKPKGDVDESMNPSNGWRAPEVNNTEPVAVTEPAPQA